jgi:HAD superfamily hydrolase (TIGR01509 family)
MQRLHWIFDLDGTLTEAVHDFAAIRAALGLPPGEPILEALAKLPAAQAQGLAARLHAIEHRLALGARPTAGALELLAWLTARGASLGILTRNSAANARATLAAAGLAAFFDDAAIVGREACAPKPSAAGVHRLLAHWGARPAEAVMVGDYLFDLQAGRDAGLATVYFDPSGVFEWMAYADHCVSRLGAIADLPVASGAIAAAGPGR